MKRTLSFLLGTLSALALGVFSSCSGNSPTAPFAQDRIVSSLDVPNLDKRVADSIAANLYPADSSGWHLQWSSPLNTEGWQKIYIFSDSLDSNAVKKLTNGTKEPDFKALGLPEPDARLDTTITTWEIPTRRLGGRQGNAVRTDTAYNFSIWVRYKDGQVGPMARYRLFLGDEMPPEIPEIQTSIGGDTVSFSFTRPKDQTGRFDTLRNGPLQRIRLLYWAGRTSADSVGDKAISLDVPQEQVADTSVRQFRLTARDLQYRQNYVFLIQVTDSVGRIATTAPFQITTRDSLPPTNVSNLRVRNVGSHTVTLQWTAPTDSFSASGQPQTTVAPNAGIRSMLVRLSRNGGPWRDVDSLDLTIQSPNWKLGELKSEQRFQWQGTSSPPVWTWVWPNLTQSDSFAVQIVVTDVTGNPSVEEAQVRFASVAAAPISCKPGYSAVSGTTTSQDYCIETFEHGVAQGKPATRLTWTAADSVCRAENAFLCSDYQWETACATFPDSAASIVRDYGAIEVGRVIDTLQWLVEVCNLATGDSLSSLSDSGRDTRCVSGWGVRDMPGQLAEWTRDAYLSSPSSVDDSQRDPWSRAWLGANDLTASKPFGTIRGGSWLVPTNSRRILPSAKCGERAYPSFTITDSTQSIPRPNPDGVSKAIGFRCCHKPL